MRGKFIAVALALSVAFAVVAGAAAQTKSSSSAKKSAPKKAGTKTAAKKTAAKGTSKQSAKQAASSRYRRSTQSQPSVDRYKEIQQSLSEKGYFKGPVDGTWGAESVDALKRFQRDQNIGDDGKLGALSLIALGLGPKRDASACAGAACGRGAVTDPKP